MFEKYVQSNTNGLNEKSGDVKENGVVRELADRAEQEVLRWLGYVERMEEGCLVKIAVLDVREIPLWTYMWCQG